MHGSVYTTKFKPALKLKLKLILLKTFLKILKNILTNKKIVIECMYKIIAEQYSRQGG